MPPAPEHSPDTAAPTDRRSIRVLLVTGSTGGHVTPALAVGEALREVEADPVFAGPVGGLAERVVTSARGEFHPLEVHPIRGAGYGRVLRGLAGLPGGALRSLQLLRLLHPDVVLGTGAHTSGPLLALAGLAGIPSLVLESNVEVGLANRWLSRWVTAVAVAWPQTLSEFPTHGLHTGWPVRQAIRSATQSDVPPADEGARLLVVGGSAGAPGLDRAVMAALSHMGDLAERLSVVHQSSSPKTASLEEGYRSAGINAEVSPFFDDIAARYRDASLVLSRAGGATLSELSALGRPAVLVPLPAAGNHQVANADAWARLGCARVLMPDTLDGETLAGTIRALFNDPDTLRTMGESAKAQDRPAAAKMIAEWCVRAAAAR